MANRRIGQILVDMGFMTDDQLEMLLGRAESVSPASAAGARLPRSMGLITDEQAGPGVGRAVWACRRSISLEGFVQLPDETREQITECDGPAVSRDPHASAKTITFSPLATCDPQNLSIQGRITDVSWGWTSDVLVATESVISPSTLEQVLRRRIRRKRRKGDQRTWRMDEEPEAGLLKLLAGEGRRQLRLDGRRGVGSTAPRFASC